MVLTLCVLYNLWTLIVRQSFPELQVSFSAILFCNLAKPQLTPHVETMFMVTRLNNECPPLIYPKGFCVTKSALFVLFPSINMCTNHLDISTRPQSGTSIKFLVDMRQFERCHFRAGCCSATQNGLFGTGFNGAYILMDILLNN